MTKLKVECSNCGKGTRIIRKNYPFTESGLNNVVLRGLEMIHCDHCGNEDPVFRAMNNVMRAIALALVKKPSRLAGEEVRFLRTYLGVTQDRFSKLLHIDKTTLSKWENNDDPVGTQSDLAIRMVVLAKDKALHSQISEVVNEELEKIAFTRQKAQQARIELNAEEIAS